MFERGGHAGMLFRYHGPDTGNRWIVVRASGKRAVRGTPATYRAGLFRENVYYFGQGGRCQNLSGGVGFDLVVSCCWEVIVGKSVVGKLRR